MLGNMLYLWIFGDNIEDRLGHFTYLIFYLLCGVGAGIVHTILNYNTYVPSIGASGAIAGILGAYFVTFPRARIATLIPLLFFFWRVDIPAVLILGYWFIIQFFTGFQMMEIQSATAGGVAWWAHVGGFIAGMLLALALPYRRVRAEPVSF